MPEHNIGTREEWQVARDELAKLEAEQAARNEEIRRKRRELPWVPVDKEYVFDTQEGKKTLGELFDGRSQLLAYNIMYGPDYKIGACPGCTNLADGFDATTLLHLNKRDVTMICFSRAPIDRLTAYKERMGWRFPYVSTEWLVFWASQVGAELKDGIRENLSYIAFAKANGAVYHTYTVSASDPFVAPYFSFLLDRPPTKPQYEPLNYCKDEYPA
jgi:predicted dithiol-disulfide oxidoreductase (DUF899 family)